MRWWLAACACLLGAAPLGAQTEQLCVGQIVPVALDGRVLGHIPYEQADPSELVSAPPGFAIGQPCLIQRDVAPDLARLLAAAANTPGVGTALHGISCYRSVEHQRAVFCNGIGPRKHARDAADRARVVGPPGHSEHATGYAIDFGVRPSPHCPDVDDCIAQTPAGRWLLAHATDYGFELSFPPGNAQGVTWEPWHWRWVGATVNAPGALRARLTLNRARIDFPASPRVNDTSDHWLRIITDPPPAATPPISIAPLQLPLRR